MYNTYKSVKKYFVTNKSIMKQLKKIYEGAYYLFSVMLSLTLLATST